MKRKILFIASLLVGLSAFAYGGYSSFFDGFRSLSFFSIDIFAKEKELQDFLSLASLAMFVLGVILFFNVWGMTNNVKKIKEAILDKKNLPIEQNQTQNTPQPAQDIHKIRQFVKRLYFTGKTEEAFDTLNKYTFERIEFDSALMVDSQGASHFADEIGREYVYLGVNGKWEKTYNYREVLQQRYEDVIKSVTPLYKAIGREIPETLKNVTYDKLNYFGM